MLAFRSRGARIAAATAIAAVTLSGAFIAGMVIGNNRAFPFTVLAPLAKSGARAIARLRMGESEYVNAQLRSQYAKDSPAGSELRTLESAVLPLTLRAVSLAKGGKFPAAGGAIANVEGTIVVLDRLGGLYAYRNDRLEALDYGEFPNNLKAFVAHSKNRLNSDSFRTHSVAYDRARGKLYVCYEKYASPSTNRFSISAISIDRKTLAKAGDWESIYEAPGLDSTEALGNAGGGKMLIAGNSLYFSIGDFGLYGTPPTSEHAAQDPKSPFGKIHEFDLSTKALKTMSLGHRNTQGLALNKNGKLVNAEHGPQGGDELNIIEEGKNYGWPVRTYGTEYGTYSWPLATGEGGTKYAEPLLAFVPSIGVSSVHLVSGFDERWNGDLLVGSLKAQSLFRVRTFGDRIVFSEPLWIGHRIRDISQLNDQIVLLTDDAQLIFMSVDRPRLASNSRSEDKVKPELAACVRCHHFGQTTPANLAPSLSNILNRKIASDGFVRYSESLRKSGGSWDKEKLARFIANPAAFAPGTGMPNLGLSPREIESIVDILSEAQ